MSDEFIAAVALMLTCVAVVLGITAVDMAWTGLWNGVAYVTGDPSYKTSGARKDDFRFATTFRERITLHPNSPNSVHSSFQISNSSDVDIRYALIRCSFKIDYGVGTKDVPDTNLYYEFGNNEAVLVPAHSTEVLTAQSDEASFGDENDSHDVTETSCTATYS